MLFGDIKQGKPFQQDDKLNPWASTFYDTSDMERLIFQGYAKIDLTVGRRYLQPICDLINSVYAGTNSASVKDMTTSSAVTREERPIAVQLEKFNKEKFGCETHLLVVDISDTQDEVVIGSSTRNFKEALALV